MIKVSPDADKFEIFKQVSEITSLAETREGHLAAITMHTQLLDSNLTDTFANYRKQVMAKRLEESSEFHPMIFSAGNHEGRLNRLSKSYPHMNEEIELFKETIKPFNKLLQKLDQCEAVYEDIAPNQLREDMKEAAGYFKEVEAKQPDYIQRPAPSKTVRLDQEQELAM